MEAIDKFLVDWAKKKRINIDDVVEWIGWPSQDHHDPYWEELPHVLNNLSGEDIGWVLPPEIIRYGLSKWVGSDVPIDHPLVKDSEKWYQVAIDREWDMASPADEKQLWILVRGIAKDPKLIENIGTFQDLVDHVDSPDLTGETYLMAMGGRPIWMVVSDDAVAFMDENGGVKMFDHNGNRLHKGAELPKVRGYIMGAAKFSHNVTDTNELASIIGNDLADLVIGKDGISILDLP